MDPLVLLLQVVSGVGGLLLFALVSPSGMVETPRLIGEGCSVLYRIVLAARKGERKGSGGVMVRFAMMFFGVVFADVPPPPPEIRMESREMRLKRDEDDGDPPEPGSSLEGKRRSSANKSHSSKLVEVSERRVE